MDLTKATSFESRTFLERARKWASARGSVFAKSTSAIYSVAEYIANTEGKTLQDNPSTGEVQTKEDTEVNP